MARRSGFSRTLKAIGRASARAIREVEVTQRAQVREYERQQRDAIRFEREGLRLRAAADKAAQKRYLELRELEVQELNANLSAVLRDLAQLLTVTLTVNDHIDLQTLKRKEEFPQFDAPRYLTQISEAPRLTPVEPLGTLSAFIPGAKAKHQRKVDEAASQHVAAMQVHKSDDRQRLETLNRLRQEHVKAEADHLKKVQQHNQEIDGFSAAYAAGEPAAVSDYGAMVLERLSIQMISRVTTVWLTYQTPKN